MKYRHSLDGDDCTFVYDVKRAAQLLLYIPESRVIATLGRSMPIENAFLITMAARIVLTDALENATVGEA